MVRLLAGERLHPAFEREIADLDFIVARADSRPFAELLGSAGYVPDEEFNALNGARRQLFHDQARGRQIDVFVGRFEMCHELPLADRIELREHSLPAADILMTKLQIASLNTNDAGDALALLHALDLGAGDRGQPRVDEIDVGWIASLAAHDWGLYRTSELNLVRLEEVLGSFELSERDRDRIRARIEGLAREMRKAPKSTRWKLRARIGDRKQWYDEPEEVDRA